MQFESSPNDPEQDHGAFRYAVTPGYFETIGIPLRRGRLLEEHDVAGAPVAVLISESFAKRKFPAQDPIGQRQHLREVGRNHQDGETLRLQFAQDAVDLGAGTDIDAPGRFVDDE